MHYFILLKDLFNFELKKTSSNKKSNVILNSFVVKEDAMQIKHRKNVAPVDPQNRVQREVRV